MNRDQGFGPLPERRTPDSAIQYPFSVFNRAPLVLAVASALVACTAHQAKSDEVSALEETERSAAHRELEPTRSRLPQTPLPQLEFGEVIFETNGPFEFTRHIWFDDYGRKALVETRRPDDPDLRTYVMTLEAEQFKWSVPRNPLHKPARTWAWEGPSISASGFRPTPDDELERLGYEHQGSSVEGGHECELWVRHGPRQTTRRCRFKGLDIYFETSGIRRSDQEVPDVAAMTAMTFANFETRPPASRFEIPKGLKWRSHRRDRLPKP